MAVSVPEANSDINNSESEDEFQDAHSELTPEMLQESNQPPPQQVANSDIVSNDTEWPLQLSDFHHEKTET